MVEKRDSKRWQESICSCLEQHPAIARCVQQEEIESDREDLAMRAIVLDEILLAEFRRREFLVRWRDRGPRVFFHVSLSLYFAVLYYRPEREWSVQLVTDNRGEYGAQS